MERKCENCDYWANRLCHLQPKRIPAEKEHWCGQFKAKEILRLYEESQQEIKNLMSKT